MFPQVSVFTSFITKKLKFYKKRGRTTQFILDMYMESISVHFKSNKSK